MEVQPIIVEQTYNAPVSNVWKALTDKEEIKKWYFDLSDFKAEKGFRFQFYGEDAECNKYLHLCEITEVLPLKKLSYTWSYDGYDGTSLVIFELGAAGNGTKMHLTHSGVENFPQNISAFARNNFVQGWKQIIGTQLKNYLDIKG